MLILPLIRLLSVDNYYNGNLLNILLNYHHIASRTVKYSVTTIEYLISLSLTMMILAL